MNPRITSITLTNIPARSIGPVIERLISFLDFASSQQNAIRQARVEINDHGTTILRGLRHIRLELDPDFSDDELGLSTGRDIDYDKLLDPGDDDFSNTFTFFEDTKQSTLNHQDAKRVSQLSHENTAQYSHWKSGRLKSPPYADTTSQYVNRHVEPSDSWTGNVYTVPVWIGPGTIGPYAAVNEYMWNLQDAKLRTNVGPAMPGHVAAGVPPMTYIFYAAWDAMVVPKNLAALVKNCGMEPLRDVAMAIKDYRAHTRGTPHHWEGNIELVRTKQALRYHAPEYWR
ncbi:hypothetical protein ONZ43_g2375 [Nemania bipapillata]|uniref:Uncharacterized protein n=1 Tax=Nemania bipapillata TaxID=110536 RepID=A0ACC2J0U6_9PEZI|nr:hypothetical protein ONZ43_g2375 [Nemania bipapillata]